MHRRSLFQRATRALACLVALAATAAHAQVTDTTSMNDKVFAAYQGWFHCPGDPGPNGNWFHWSYVSQLVPDAKMVSVPGFPITDEYPAESRCPVPGLTVNGQQAYFFTSLALGTAETHFRWMREYGIDGAMLQRFIGSVTDYYQEDDIVLRNAFQAAQDNGRSIMIEYDMSGDFNDTHTQAEEDALFDRVTHDWTHLVDDLHVLDNPMYQKHNGKPVVSLWGMGRPANELWGMKPALARRVIAWFKDTAHVTVIGGVSPFWMELPEWKDVLAMLDVVQPWNVGAYGSDGDLDWQLQNRIKPQLAATEASGQLYMPTVFPASSGRDQANGNRPSEGAASLGGAFFWHQAFDDRGAGVRTIKIAMFDEVGEGTSLLKIASDASQTPPQIAWLNLDADGLRLPHDWNLRIAHEVVGLFHGQPGYTRTVPSDPGPFDTSIPECGVLGPNQVVAPATPLFSCDGHVSLRQENDGTAGVYRDGKRTAVIGHAGTSRGNLIMQGDGNLVGYDVDGRPLWSTSTENHVGAYAYVRNDGGVQVIFEGDAIWTFKAP
jgi:hypothetical protein